MAAVVTTEFVTQLIKDSKKSFDGNLYIGLGKSTTWGVGDTPETPLTTFEYARESRGRIQHVKIVTGVAAAIPRQDWTSQEIYVAYDDSDQADIPYVMNSNYEVFLCTQQGVNNDGVVIPSTVEPTKAQLTFSSPNILAGENILRTADSGAATDRGYEWRYLFTVSQEAVNLFLTLNYIPVFTFETDPQDEDVQSE